ncbi:hypothetical protein PLICRDRAFT_54055 [Plicaturopsis crispa FD-325 SS-3]|nr:hypothetical protein PLICRDRAFT_54055 [Plicaturopsis crispa FD-325 SS-3]
MFSFVGFTLAALVASAFAAPADTSVQCTQLGRADLKLFPTPRAVNASVPGTGQLLGLDPVRDVNLHPFLQAYNGVDEAFDYYSCKSAFMNYSTVQTGYDHTVYYGHIRSSTNSSNCLGLADLSGGTIIAAPCSYTDDASQLNQFWTITQNTTAPFPLDAKLTGKVWAPQTTAGYYATQTGYLGGNQVVSAQKIDGLNYHTPYQLTLVAHE